MKRLIVVCALMLSALAAPASAAVIFNVNGQFTFQGTSTAAGTLTGTFTTNDAITQVTGINLLSSVAGAFQSLAYTDVSKVDAQFLPQYFRLTVNGGYDQLQIVFSPALSLAGSAIGGNAFEHQAVAGNRILAGSVGVATAAVPEPATWAMMIAGFGLAGAMLRRRQRTLATA